MAEMVQGSLSRADQQERHHHGRLPQLVVHEHLPLLPSLPVHAGHPVRQRAHAFLGHHGRQLHQLVLRRHFHGIRRHGSRSGKNRSHIPGSGPHGPERAHPLPQHPLAQLRHPEGKQGVHPPGHDRATHLGVKHAVRIHAPGIRHVAARLPGHQQSGR